MNRILQTGRTGLDSMQRKMDTIAHNIANVQTVGYKNLDVQFADLVYDQLANRGIPLTPEAREKSIEIGTGSRVRSIMHRFVQGTPQESSKPLDLAILGDGFFGLQDQNGEVFLTRNGAFTTDGNGGLVDSSGNHVLLDLYAPLQKWSENEISIDVRGVITSSDETGQVMEIGRLLLFDVPDKALLTSVGDNYFSVERQADILFIDNQTGGSKILQGYLECSTVDIAKELIDMFVTQRAYSINTKSIHAADEMWSMVNQLRR